MCVPYASTCTGSSMEIAARPVRSPPSPCFSVATEPCIRRFTSLISNVPDDMSFSLASYLPVDAVAGAWPDPDSTGDDGAMPLAAQNSADRAGFGDRKHDDRD